MALTPERRAQAEAILAQKSQPLPQLPQKQSFLKETGKAIAKPFLKSAATSIGVLRAGDELLSGNVSGAKQAFTDTRVLGQAPVRSLKDLAGTALEIGSYAVPVGAGAKVASNVARTGLQSLRQGAVAGARLAGTGAVAGGLTGTGQALQEDRAIFPSALQGATVGAIATPALGAVGAVVGAGVRKLASMLPERPVTPISPTVPQPTTSVAPKTPKPFLSQVKQSVQKEQRGKVAKELEDIGFQKDVQNLIVNATDETKAKMNELFKRAEQKDVSRLANQPIYKLAQDFQQSLKTISKEAQQNANKIKAAVAKSPNTVIDTSSAQKNFLRELNKYGASVGNDGKIIFGPRITNTADQKILQETFDFISQPQGVVDLYRRNQAIFDALKLGKANNELSIAENATAKLRTDLQKLVGEKLGIREQSKNFARLNSLVEPINKLLGTRYTPEEVATLKTQEIIGRLLNRNTGRPTALLQQVVKESAKLQGKNPDKAWSEFLRQVEFTDVLEDVFGIAPSRSLKTQVGTGALGAAEAVADVAIDRVVPFGSTIKTVAKGFMGREKPLKQEQIKALKKLLNIK